MSHNNRPRLAICTVALALCALSQPITAQTGAAPQRFTAEQLAERAVQRRAVEAVIWGMPAVNFERMVDGLVHAKGEWNQVVYWSRLPDWKNQTLTPNPDVIYLMPFYDTRNGPVVLEIPPAEGGSITGSVDEGWQTAIEDVGPAGVDKGKGGKYLILPPGYKDKVPDGYIPMPSSTYAGFALLRSNIGSGSDADIAKAAVYGRKVRIYPLAQAAIPPATRFVDAIDTVYDSTIPYDLRFFEKLHRFVQREPWIERDRAMIDALKSIGIEKGKPFAPDRKTQAILQDAVAEARAWLDTTYEAGYVPYFSGSRWGIPVSPDVLDGMRSNFGKPDSYPVSGRGVLYTFGFFSARHGGRGQAYLATIKDKAGQALDGGSTYRLTVPPNAPVRLYWSATAYDRATHALIRDQKWSSRASTSQGLQKNADGSVDVFFGPKAPQGKEMNWVPTQAGGRFEVLFRFYGPEKPLFDKTWQLPDIEKLQ
ncbi:DUF1254 domain-containing protein [Massilia cavernae]|uniref:DUF1254 domain-containing protein n=1 Tax=Massilia cavernae TaxID=2320864 RepID=A0A418X774_9BURK|nr:DUF1254 domain-containing protein [Massilia cavernae]RJG08355.1 DUF1254 domain-containing protein [Massilia cavernae]